MYRKYLVLAVVGMVTMMALGGCAAKSNPTPPTSQNSAVVDPKWEALAKALTQAKAKFYGATWCSHCQDQKAMFGAAFEYVPYIECAPDPNNPYRQAEVCKAANIEAYPTWVFDTGIKVMNVMTFDELASQIGWTYNIGPSTN